MIGGAPELPNEGWLDAEHVRTIDEEANRRLAHVPADEHVIRGHQRSSGVIRGHQGSSGVISGTRLAHVPANEHVSIYRAHEPRECDEQLHLMREAITC